MHQLTTYALVAAVVFGVNLMPAFGPPTWAVLVFFTLNGAEAAVPLVLIGAGAAAGGRLLLALGFRRLRGHVSERQRANLQAAGKVLGRDRKRSVLGLALFAVSPLPSAQLFEAAGLIGVALRPLTAAFFAGRLVSYALYVGGAHAAADTSAGQLVRSSFTSPWGVALQIALLAGSSHLPASTGSAFSGVMRRSMPWPLHPVNSPEGGFGTAYPALASGHYFVHHRSRHRTLRALVLLRHRADEDRSVMAPKLCVLPPRIGVHPSHAHNR